MLMDVDLIQQLKARRAAVTNALWVCKARRLKPETRLMICPVFEALKLKHVTVCDSVRYLLRDCGSSDHLNKKKI